MTEKTVALSLAGGPPWGFRLRGGPAQGGLRVSRVRRRSPASTGGLREGDLLLSLNSQSLNGRTYAFVMDIVERQRTLALEVRRFITQEGVTLQLAPDSWGSDEEGDDEPPLQELQVAELQLAPAAPPLLVDKKTGGMVYFEPDGTIVPADPEVRPVPLSKLIREAEPEPTPPRSPVKKYADSAYFDATDASYPTVEEQKEMARRVAETLTDTRNRGSRGASMFEKRRERAAKYTLEGPEPGDEAADADGASAMIDTSVSAPIDEGSAIRVPIPPPMAPPPPAPPPPAPPPPPPPGQPWGLRFPAAPPAPREPPPKTVAEFVEREMRSAPKLTHRDYDPKKAFDIASALHASSGKAGQMFQKRRQRAMKFTTETEGQAVAPNFRADRRAEPILASAAVAGGPALSQPTSAMLPPMKLGNDASLAAKIQRLQENLGGSAGVGGVVGGGGSLAGLSDL